MSLFRSKCVLFGELVRLQRLRVFKEFSWKMLLEIILVFCNSGFKEIFMCEDSVIVYCLW